MQGLIIRRGNNGNDGGVLQIPLGNVTNLSAKAGDQSVTLTFGDPDDIYVGNILVAQWVGTKIIRKAGGYPTNESDGVLVVNITVRNQYATTGFVDTGLENGVTYYYQAFPIATSGAVNTNVVNRISATPLSVSRILAENSWAQIAEIAASGKAAEYWQIGDEKDIKLSTNETFTLRIEDFNHDNLASGGKAPITFGMKHLFAEKRAWHSSNVFINWSASDIRAYISTTILGRFPDDLKQVIKPVLKISRTVGQSGATQTTTDSLWMFSQSEIVSGYTFDGYTYPAFTDNNSRIKKLSNGSGAVNGWWTRSGYVGELASIYMVYPTGGGAADYLTALDYSYCVGFCI